MHAAHEWGEIPSTLKQDTRQGLPTAITCNVFIQLDQQIQMDNLYCARHAETQQINIKMLPNCLEFICGDGY